MSDKFFDLPSTTQADILKATSIELNITDVILGKTMESDLGICQ